MRGAAPAEVEREVVCVLAAQWCPVKATVPLLVVSLGCYHEWTRAKWAGHQRLQCSPLQHSTCAIVLSLQCHTPVGG